MSTKNFRHTHGRFVEMIAWTPRGKTFNPLFWANMTGVYFDVPEERLMHPYQKPLALVERLVRIHSSRGDLVLDCFCGSGTTLVACKRLGRRWIGVDHDEHCLVLARERLRAQ